MFAIRVEHIGFTVGRFILGNLILARETCNWAQQTGQNMILIKLDFDKAYDRI